MLQEAVMEYIQEPSHKLQSYWKETISKEILIKSGWKLSFKAYLSQKFLECRKSRTSNLLIQIMLQFSSLIVVSAYAPLFSPFAGFYLADGGSCGEIQQWLLRLKPCTFLIHLQSTWQVRLIIRDGIGILSLLWRKYFLVEGAGIIAEVMV